MQYLLRSMQGRAHTLNCLIPALRNIDYDLRSVFNRYPLTRYRYMTSPRSRSSLVVSIHRYVTIATVGLSRVHMSESMCIPPLRDTCMFCSRT